MVRLLIPGYRPRNNSKSFWLASEISLIIILLLSEQTSLLPPYSLYCHRIIHLFYTFWNRIYIKNFTSYIRIRRNRKNKCCTQLIAWSEAVLDALTNACMNEPSNQLQWAKWVKTPLISRTKVICRLKPPLLFQAANSKLLSFRIVWYSMPLSVQYYIALVV